ncbi:protein SSX1-like isoform X2 [Bubalus kerabau]|uniref:protein SSX1-like isoform X2 n=1 Tax=Bubalus carabanensis TaxID=3119969 RepID=UPI00244EDE19|nr:protein SSX1-like isoform X2 [Bubalus carabanensis]
MNRGSFWENPREDRKKLEKKSKAFKTISQYFSKKEWARLGYSEKITYVNMKRNYETMTRLDEPPQGTSNMQGRKLQKVTPKKPVKGKKRSKIVPGTSGPEQAQRQLGSRAKASISAQQSKKTSGSKRKKVWANRLRKRKPVAYEEISDSEEESNGNTVDVWANRLREREPVAQEEISDREEESNGNTVNVWANRLRERKPVVYEEIREPEEESNGNTVNVWANRLRKRKPVAYEEIIDPEEEEDEDD